MIIIDWLNFNIVYKQEYNYLTKTFEAWFYWNVCYKLLIKCVQPFLTLFCPRIRNFCTIGFLCVCTKHNKSMQCSYNLLCSALYISILRKPLHALHAEPVSACGLDRANSPIGLRWKFIYAIAKTNREKCVLANWLQLCDRTV